MEEILIHAHVSGPEGTLRTVWLATKAKPVDRGLALSKAIFRLQEEVPLQDKLRVVLDINIGNNLSVDANDYNTDKEWFK